MQNTLDRLLHRISAEQSNEKLKEVFQSLGQGNKYTDEQKALAFELIDEYGIRATTKILGVPRRTLQRWCRKNNVDVFI